MDVLQPRALSIPEAIVALKQQPLTLAAAAAPPAPLVTTTTSASTSDVPDDKAEASVAAGPLLNWHGAPPRFDPVLTMQPRAFRAQVRQGLFTGPTNAICPGFLQCNLVVLPANTKEAFDFLLFCQRNPQACPLLEVCTGIGKESTCPVALAPDADLRTDCPKYALRY
jgi:hypothetical protein